MDYFLSLLTVSSDITAFMLSSLHELYNFSELCIQKLTLSKSLRWG